MAARAVESIIRGKRCYSAYIRKSLEACNIVRSSRSLLSAKVIASGSAVKAGVELTRVSAGDKKLERCIKGERRASTYCQEDRMRKIQLRVFWTKVSKLITKKLRYNYTIRKEEDVLKNAHFIIRDVFWEAQQQLHADAAIKARKALAHTESHKA